MSDVLQAMSVSGTVTQTMRYTADGRMARISRGIASPGGQLITSFSYNQAPQLSAVDAGSPTLSTLFENCSASRV